jgi:hypothetical protein
MRRSILFVAVACLLAWSTSTQATSIFSYHPDGVGWWDWPSNGRIAAMGGASVGVYDESNPLGMNPATNAAMERGAMTAVFLGQKRVVLDQGSKSAQFFDQHPRIIRIVTPTAKGVVVGVGFEPLSDVVVKWSGGGDLGDTGMRVKDSLDANGGLWSGTFEVAREFGAFSVGAEWSIIRGAIGTEWRRTVLDADGARLPMATSALLRRTYAGNRFGLGAVYRIGETLKAPAIWTFGTVLHLPTSLDQSTIMSSGTRIPSVIYPTHEDNYAAAPDLNDTTEGQTDLPLSLSIGATYRPGDRLLAALDLTYMRWSQVSSKFTDLLQTSLGVEIHPSSDYRSFYPLQWPYRFGVRLENQYVEAGNSAPTNWYLSTGFGLPLGGGSGQIDYSFEYGQRGSVSENHVRERVWRHTISIVGWERMFQYRPRR